MPSGPKSTQSLYAGRRASGNSWASTTTPTRMSTRSKSAQVMAIAHDLLDQAEGGAGIVVGEDLLGGMAQLGHGLRRRLVHADAVPVAPPGEPGRHAVHSHGEQRALERVVADQTPE